jgi:hypothetical protein
MHEHVKFLLSIQDLEYFLGFEKQQLIQSCELYLTRLEAKAPDHLTKFILHKMKYKFCLRSNLITGAEVKLSLCSMQ